MLERQERHPQNWDQDSDSHLQDQQDLVVAKSEYVVHHLHVFERRSHRCFHREEPDSDLGGQLLQEAEGSVLEGEDSDQWDLGACSLVRGRLRKGRAADPVVDAMAVRMPRRVAVLEGQGHVRRRHERGQRPEFGRRLV